MKLSYDINLRKSLNSLNQNLWMLRLLRPILITLEATIAFISFFLLFYSRRREVVIMRSLGVRRAEVSAGVLIESFFLCFCGVVLYILFCLSEKNLKISACTIGIILACMAGSFFSCWLINRQNNTRILREKE